MFHLFHLMILLLMMAMLTHSLTHFIFDVIDDAPDHDDYGGVGLLDDLTFDAVEGNNDVRSIFRPV